ncbi:MAG: multicopper oxidase domain-containing protein [Deferrisomatales bacterium]
MGSNVNRRDFLRYGTFGLAAFGLGSVTGIPGYFRREAHAELPPRFDLDGPISISMEEAMFEMVDGIRIYHWAFRDPAGTMRIPGPVLFVTEGDMVRIDVANRFPQGHTGVHSFGIPGIPGAESGPIPVGQTARVEFPAPTAGTYLYLDTTNAPVNMAMGLHGCLIVMPRRGNTPYSNPSPAVQQLFDEFGFRNWAPGKGSDHFPGHPWDPARQWLWFSFNVDPLMNAAIRTNPNFNAATFVRDSRPQYFMMNGKAGAFGSHPPDVFVEGNVGQPALIRMVHAGVFHHSMHIHGNHAYMLAENNTFGRPDRVGAAPLTDELDLPRNFGVHDNLAWLDTWRMQPGDRKDVLVPFILPPDIPVDRDVDPANSALTVAERAARLHGTLRNGQPLSTRAAKAWPILEETFPMDFPMHCHNEPSQTAAGANYPGGVVTHWGFKGDIDMRWFRNEMGVNRRQELIVIPGIDGVVLPARALFHLKTAKLELEGGYSGPRGTRLEIFAGPEPDPARGGVKVGECTVGADGRWFFRGRAVAALATRRASVRALPPPSVAAALATIPVDATNPDPDPRGFASERRSIALELR